MFSFRKKNQEKKPCCCCGNGNKTVDNKKVVDEIKSIKVLGAGCKLCHQLYENTKQAALNIGISIEVEYITDMQKVMEYGAMSMPVIVVNETVVSQGKVLKTEEVEKLLLGC